jgi:selenide,water dikinase
MESIPKSVNPKLLVGTETADDAGIFKISDDIALVQTVDVFTPIVDDPYTFGRIVAANSMSDVWAMGGEVLTVLNLLGYPPKKMNTDSAAQLLRGVVDNVHQAGGVICGGHTWMDPELRAGLSVTGIVHPDKIVTNAGAKPGDALILTKPIGGGILCFAAIQKEINETDIEHVVKSMMTLNKPAAQAMTEVGVHACTDITGFSLLGHAVEMAEAGKVCLEIYVSRIPLFKGVETLAEQDIILPLGRENEQSFGNRIDFHPEIQDSQRKILFDPQTSGGLLIAVEEGKRDSLLEKMQEKNVISAQWIGKVADSSPGRIQVQP